MIKTSFRVGWVAPIYRLCPNTARATPGLIEEAARAPSLFASSSSSNARHIYGAPKGGIAVFGTDAIPT
ncbi:hypothetical protein [Salinihabitans flavidus]|uniref:hypothetical protein n=1 Tax=Salinihabitans flavidus TaxID=569882 RepID=UPI000B84FE02|nr:hypothetical protein [Salinihabitans flavidus]